MYNNGRVTLCRAAGLHKGQGEQTARGKRETGGLVRRGGAGDGGGMARWQRNVR